jgi:hypothetical protein
LPFALHRLPFAIRPLPFALHRLPFTIHPSPFAFMICSAWVAVTISFG